MSYPVSTIGALDPGVGFVRRPQLGSVSEVVAAHGGPYVIFGVGVLMGFAVGAAVFGGKRGR